MGAAIPFVREKTFQRGDGGWDRIVWIHESLKKQVADAIPEELYDKIATEVDSPRAVDLEPFLREKGHPVVEKYWSGGKPVPLDVPAPTQDWPEDVGK
jgi:acetyl-CoA decarbonylase/synthase complex subunit beta